VIDTATNIAGELVAKTVRCLLRCPGTPSQRTKHATVCTWSLELRTKLV